ncbi:MAG: hypothetical protein SPD80_02795 [Atopobium sp.]|nr:hypothetical protein [Atopobium sp.]MDY4522507.1 hypothetical protein [Atopobium sp.]
MKAKKAIVAVINGREYRIKKGETIPAEIIEYVKAFAAEKENKND